MKALVMIRASTEAQKIEDQHNEMVRFCSDEGYDELVFVEDKGASAIKLNDQYRVMIDQVKEEIGKDRDIRCFAVWELSRAFRNEGVYYEIKTFLLERGVQFLCKNPYLKLLNPDGSLNSGMEIAMSLLATLAKQEMELKMERFRRAKKSMWNSGKFIGGVVKYGYRVEGDGSIVIDEEKAEGVRKLFELYSTGKWSVRTLSDEMNERGYDIRYNSILNILSSDTYVFGPYPQMISQELWERCVKVRKRNYLSIPKGSRYCFGSGVFKCSVCGKSMVAEGDQYRCRHHNKYSAPPHCDNGLTIRVDNLDGLLWFVARREELLYRGRMDRDRRKEYESQLKVLREKVQATRKKLESMDDKKARINELYVEGMIGKEEFKIRQNKTLLEVKRYKDTLLSYKEQEGALLSLLEGKREETLTDEKLRTLISGVYKIADLKMMNETVKKHIKRVTSSPEWFGKERDRRAVRQNAQLITVETVYSGIQRYFYCARGYKGYKFWLFGDKEIPLCNIKPIIRECKMEVDKRMFKKISEWDKI